MTRPARANPHAALKANAAADALLDWLQGQRRTGRDPRRDLSAVSDRLRAEAPWASALGGTPPKPSPIPDRPEDVPSVTVAAPMRLPHPDWLHHRLVVTGPADALANFRVTACGAGTIPWMFDGLRLEEDLFHLLVAPPPPQRRRLSLAGARALARQLREAAEQRHALTVTRIGQSQACPLDLHALVPVPPPILILGADHPEALAWLWTYWGTTDGLRHVTVEPAAPLRTPLRAGMQTLGIHFWSADWTPWRVIATIRARWSTLTFDIRPTYGPV